MANTSSAKKQSRAAVKRAQRNRSVKSAVKTHVARARRAISDGTDGVSDLATTAIRSLDRAASKGILHPNNAARRKARLMKRLNTTAAAATTAGDAAGTGAATGRKTGRGRGTAATPASSKSTSGAAAKPAARGGRGKKS